MANYVDNNLRKDEHVVVRAKISWLTLVMPVIWFVLVWVVYVMLVNKLGGVDKSGSANGEQMKSEAKTILLVVALLFSFIPLIKQLLINVTTHLAITNKRIVGKVGVLKVDAIDFPINKIDNVSYQGSFFGNIFKYYTVKVQSTSAKPREIKAIANAAEFKNAVTDAIDTYAEEARKAQAAEIAAAMGNKPQM